MQDSTSLTKESVDSIDEPDMGVLEATSSCGKRVTFAQGDEEHLRNSSHSYTDSNHADHGHKHDRLRHREDRDPPFVRDNHIREHGRDHHREHGRDRQRREADRRIPRMDETNKNFVTQLRELAGRIEGRCTKFPTTGGGLLGFSRERYVAVLPFDEMEGQISFRDQTQGLSWNRQLGLWRRGKLGYWHSQEHYRREEEPKGGIPLMCISKVEWDNMTPLDVSVRHKDKETGMTQELILQFPSEERAQEWRDTLHKIRSLLRDTVMQM